MAAPEVEKEEAHRPAPSLLSSTPLKGKPARVVAVAEEEDKAKPSALAPTNLGVTPLRFKNVAEPVKVPAAPLASTPLKGLPQR